MDLDWADLELLLAIHEGGSLSKAGKSLGVNQSTITRRLDHLESKTRASYFVRSARGVHATELTQRLLPIAERARLAVREARAELTRRSGSPSGTVRISCLEVLADYVFVPALPRLWERAPGVELELVPSLQQARLLQREADIGIRLVKPEAAELLARKMRDIDLAPFASRDYIAKLGLEGRAVAPSAVEWINWPKELATQFGDARWIEGYASGKVRVRSTSARTMLVAARAGLGVILLPRIFANLLGDMAEVRLTQPPVTRAALWPVRATAPRDDPAVQATMAWTVAGRETRAAAAGP